MVRKSIDSLTARLRARLRPGPDFWTLERHSNAIRYFLAVVFRP